LTLTSDMDSIDNKYIVISKDDVNNMLDDYDKRILIALLTRIEDERRYRGLKDNVYIVNLVKGD